MNCCKCGGDMRDEIESGDYVTCEHCGGPFHLSEWDGEDFNCGCTTLSAESSKGSVRTMSGKSHRPRPLVKDRNLSPREARTRKQVRGESFGAEKGKERVVESKEESGIITKTVQREDKSYDVDKMRASIPKRYRNQVDEDDRLVGAIGVALGVVATMAYQRFTAWWSSRDQ